MKKTTTNQKPTSEQKYTVVMRILQKDKSFAAICNDEQISPTTALKWVEQFLINGRQALEIGSTEKQDRRDAELFYLRNEVTRLYAMNDALKRKIFDGITMYGTLVSNSSNGQTPETDGSRSWALYRPRTMIQTIPALVDAYYRDRSAKFVDAPEKRNFLNLQTRLVKAILSACKNIQVTSPLEIAQLNKRLTIEGLRDALEILDQAHELRLIGSIDQSSYQVQIQTLAQTLFSREVTANGQVVKPRKTLTINK